MKHEISKEKIQKALNRGVEHIYPSAEFLEKKLESGQRLTIYNGIDPTGPTLHIGHGVVLRKLAQFQELGHKVILLIGDFTAMIGDPTDKSAARVKQTREEVLENARLYKEQAAHFLRFDGENPAEIRHNSDWLAKMSFEDVLELSSNFTHSQMIKRDMFQKRIEEGKDLYMHELLYPMMQGYDSVAMEVDGEVGGNDQTFNMLAGRDLQKKIQNKEKFVVSTKLLVDPSGKKMGKTEGNMVSFTDSPADMFGKIMSWPDTLLPLAFELCTDTEGDLQNPREAKLALATIIVGSYFGQEAGELARERFIQTFSKKGEPDDAPEFRATPESTLVDILLTSGLVSSKSEFRRLVDEGAVSIDGEKITDPLAAIHRDCTVKVGKHRFLKIITSSLK